MSDHRIGDTKYMPLVRQLQALPSDQDAVTLTFADIEAIIGTTLPPAARLASYWSGGGSIGPPLQRAGWRSGLTVRHNMVTFHRRLIDPPARRRCDYAAIATAYQAGASVPAVARRLGVGTNTVYHALRRSGILLRGRH